MGALHVLLVYFLIVGSGNAVNITDGLDGLATVPVIFVAIGLSFIAWVAGNSSLAEHMHVFHLYPIRELVISCTAVIGASLGFLWFNAYPAQIFMGDMGSLSLGGVLGVIAFLLHQELLFAIISGVFIIETLSVILQVLFFKSFARRLFKMAPLHHHYELSKYSEPLITIRFWIVAFIFLLLGLFIFFFFGIL
jgi:phospho-N-acetylmuramoyl-pentapeptide-transferase